MQTHPLGERCVNCCYLIHPRMIATIRWRHSTARPFRVHIIGPFLDVPRVGASIVEGEKRGGGTTQPNEVVARSQRSFFPIKIQT